MVISMSSNTEGEGVFRLDWYALDWCAIVGSQPLFFLGSPNIGFHPLRHTHFFLLLHKQLKQHLTHLSASFTLPAHRGHHVSLSVTAN